MTMNAADVLDGAANADAVANARPLVRHTITSRRADLADGTQ